MKRLRHPIRAIREPFGTAGLIVAMIALVAALGGTALAASKLNSTQKKEVEKIAKKYAGKPGAAGATGPAGAAGSAGPAGAAGKNGAPGTNGTDGTDGKEGSPWTAGGTLPKGATETGTFSAIFTVHASGDLMSSPISFTIPLEATPEAHYFRTSPRSPEGLKDCTAGSPTPQEEVECEEANENIKRKNEEAEEANEAEREALQHDCKNSSAEHPEAAPGNLCVFASIEDASSEAVPGYLTATSATGSIVLVTSPASPGAKSLTFGTWAVTGE
jgi:hypothetical protein